jgi:methylenetetrahydrofolate/methylenetetrahydromethanopterin dehydrogenase (NADP+)
MSPTPASTKPTILIQLDVDPQPSVFDGVVAVDSGVDHLFRHGGIAPEAVRDLVHGAIFTRGPADLRSTAIFVGGSDVGRAEAVFDAVKKSFFGPFRVSVLFDPNGANTTAAAAVMAVRDGLGGAVEGVRVAVLGGTGPVGGRVARLLAGLGASVTIGSRNLERAKAAARAISDRLGRPIDAFDSADLTKGLEGAVVVVAAGAAGAVLLPRSVRSELRDVKVLIDLNAVPPLGIEGVEATDKRIERDGILAWGALGVGGTKMKIHKAALKALFNANDKALDAEEILAIGLSLE